MERTDKLLSCEEVNGWDMVHYLSELGHEPKQIRGQDYWYISPLRDERTASFKVFRKGNVWYDHGIGEGGSLVDFCIAYFGCNVRELLQRLNEGTARPIALQSARLPEPDDPDKHIQIETVQPLTSGYLKHYLISRNIPLEVGENNCKEVVFSMHRKTYRALGFSNRSGGYELRNAWFKGSNSPKDITLLETDSKKLSVFEGFFDFLSHQVLLQKRTESSDFLILNSLSFVSDVQLRFWNPYGY